MPKTKQQKIEIVNLLVEKFNRASIVIFSSFATEGEGGLSVGQMQELKRSLKTAESEYVVSKKTLAGVALNKASYSGIIDAEKFEGSLGITFSYGDVIAAPKAVYNFAKNNKALKLLGALMGEEFIDLDRLTAIAKLPGREALIGQALGMIKSPISGLARVLQGNLRNLVLVLANIHK